MIGKTISHYRILEELGRGGMGVVYKAEDAKLKREVAIKFLPHRISVNEEERKRFEIEAQAAASLNHPNISTIHSIEEVEDQIFIVMEYIDGEELKDKIKGSPLPVDEAINIAIQITEGLEAAHKKGIIHRDIKSQNIMITNESKVKIMDFGLAKIGGTQITKIGTTIGTAAYMSTEQARGEEVDHRTDIWSFGVVLYEMLTGKLPFRGSYDQAIMYAILNHIPDSIEKISTELNFVIQKTLAKEPENRYQSVEELLNDLKQIKNGSLIGGPSVRETLFIKKKNKKWIIPSGISILILLSIIYFYFINISEKVDSPIEKKLVVLPFENLGVPADEYFADGITQEISARLRFIKGLGIVSHSSAVYYKNSRKTLPEISKELNVDYILSGSIRWEKSEGINKVKIIPSLTQVSDNMQIWAESYENKPEEIFSLQGDIASQIAAALNITLDQSEKKEIEIEFTKNFDAYKSYLQATDAWFIFSNTSDESFENIERSIKLFERSVQLDPQFSQAWARLSITYLALYWFGYVKTSEQLALAKEAADKAMQLNAESTESLTSMGYYFYWGLLDYNKALTFIKKAISISPNDTKLIMTNALILRRKGDFKKAAKLIEKAILLDPKVAHNYDELGVTYKLIREYDKADKSFNHSIKIAPDKFNAYAELAQNYWLCCGDLKRAREIVNSIPVKTVELNIHMLFEINILNKSYREGLHFINYMNREVFEELKFWAPAPLLRGRLYQLMGNADSANIEYSKARVILENKVKESPADYRVRMTLGLTYAGLGLYKEAIEEGKKAEELYPLSKDAIIGNVPILTLAYIYSLAGEYEAALDKIDELLSRPFEFSVAVLKIDPRFDALRNHPKYKEILEKYSE